MSYYDLSKDERIKLSEKIFSQIVKDLRNNSEKALRHWFSDEDTYIRKVAYLAVGKIYTDDPDSRTVIPVFLGELLSHPDFRIRQSAINAAGEIGKKNFKAIEELIRKGMTDSHHSVRNAVIGSLKKMGEKNPEPVMAFSGDFILHPDPEIRREICHGLELRGRTHPEEILPLLKKLQFEKVSRVRKMLIHVIGQIAYKKNGLEKVLTEIRSWENKNIVDEAAREIIDVHIRYERFAFYKPARARDIITDFIK